VSGSTGDPIVVKGSVRVDPVALGVNRPGQNLRQVRSLQQKGRWLQGERVDADLVLAQAELHVAAVKECREIQQKALAASRRPEDERVANVLDVQVIRERRVVWCLERRQRRWQQWRAGTALLDAEKEAQVCYMRFEQRDSPHVECAVTGRTSVWASE